MKRTGFYEYLKRKKGYSSGLDVRSSAQPHRQGFKYRQIQIFVANIILDIEVLDM